MIMRQKQKRCSTTDDNISTRMSSSSLFVLRSSGCEQLLRQQPLRQQQQQQQPHRRQLLILLALSSILFLCWSDTDTATTDHPFNSLLLSTPQHVQAFSTLTTISRRLTSKGLSTTTTRATKATKTTTTQLTLATTNTNLCFNSRRRIRSGYYSENANSDGLIFLSTTTTVLYSEPPTAPITTSTGSNSSTIPTTSTSPPPLSQSSTFNDSTSQDTSALTMSSSYPSTSTTSKFDIDTALFCAGLAFDSYVEPPANSSRWERGSKGMNVAFVSPAFTRNLYQGLVEVTPIECRDLPEEDSTVESIATGGGVDACIMVAAVEGTWKEDLHLIKKERYHRGIFDLSGAAHVGRSRTCWANVNINKSNASKKKTGIALPYHIPKQWGGSGAKAIWPQDEPPFYVYIQDPANVHLVFTLLDDDVLGDGSVIGSTYIAPLAKYLPQVKYTQQEFVARIKQEIITKVQRGEISPEMVDDVVATAVANNVKGWEGDLKMTSKPRIEDKKGQMAMGAAAGAWLAGPVGAAAGAAFGALYEGDPRGIIKVRLRYLPIIQGTDRPKYQVLGGLPGIYWGELYEKYLQSKKVMYSANSEIGPSSMSSPSLEGNITNKNIATTNTKLGGHDLEHCFFINHDQTGGSCAVYRSLEQKLILVSFRGTCQPIDLVTDASIFQEPWVEGEYDEREIPTLHQVHVGFRKSLNSISRRLKELILAAVAPGDNFNEYDLLVTGHSLGGALATLFVADIAEFGVDAGRALPQKAPSEPWWRAIANTVMGATAEVETPEPPRPKTLRMYNFGSPRVGNPAFAERFERFIEEGRINQAYRIVNSQDVVARVPRPMLNIDYEHCGRTVLIEEPSDENDDTKNDRQLDGITGNVIWIEGESTSSRVDPVRDYRSATIKPMAEGSLLNELYRVYLDAQSPPDILDAAASVSTISNSSSSDDIPSESDTSNNSGSGGDRNSSNQLLGQFTALASRLSKASMADLTSIIGIDRTYANRELQIVQSFLKGDALAHHLEDSYYAALGSAVGFVARVGEDIVPLSVDE